MQKIKAVAQSGAVALQQIAPLYQKEQSYPTPGLDQLTHDAGKDHPHFPVLSEQIPFSSSTTPGRSVGLNPWGANTRFYYFEPFLGQH